MNRVCDLALKKNKSDLIDYSYFSFDIISLQLVTAFAVSATASNWERIGKPFNPLLGETYELDRW